MLFDSQEQEERQPFCVDETEKINSKGPYSQMGTADPPFLLILFPNPGQWSRKGAEMREEKLLNYLKGACTGRKYRASSAELEAVLGISGTDLRKLVNRMRRKGIPIGSDRWGYFYATTAGEVYSTIQQLKTMENGLAAARRGLEQSLDAFPLREGAS